MMNLSVEPFLDECLFSALLFHETLTMRVTMIPSKLDAFLIQALNVMAFCFNLSLKQSYFIIIWVFAAFVHCFWWRESVIFLQFSRCVSLLLLLFLRQDSFIIISENLLWDSFPSIMFFPLFFISDPPFILTLQMKDAEEVTEVLSIQDRLWIPFFLVLSTKEMVMVPPFSCLNQR